MTRYVIIGAGAIGAHLAAQLTSAGIPAVLVARGRQLDALRAGPLVLRKADGDERVRLRVVADAAEARLTTDDVLVLAVKSQDAEEVISGWAWLPLADSAELVAADLPLVVLQNGVATEDAARRRFARVVSVATIVPVNYLEPGVVIPYAAGGTGYLQVGALDGRQDADAGTVASVAADLEAAGYLVRVRTDITRRKHEKLLHNILNAVSVLDGDDRERTLLSDGLVAEARAVLEAAGVDLDIAADVDPGRAVGGGREPQPPTAGRPAFRGSTWQNFARGTRSELDFLNGEIVLLGRRHGVPTPLNERVQRVLGRSELLGEGPGAHRIGEILELAPVA
ncbi:2-dehydropantoate 2-reductase N-terminal domain-containing protein [Galbitalea sp. SE-J8]|uniref:ketopantoate reductase family protein n=1 Tax=Galbitalea sp. SE-J8 TaxID=3054952 RepID=UPI00259CD985|nr:2-dehydropantoate 2-reductase N-terminal domain-containing protein [Galbitalea sp. SE-J8]MDM4761588.1 2-dehydropantoate 2-reductase N-terminal domain-containing protein [Galbitalea sp. SE-J8]